MDSVVALSKAPYAAETAEKTANCKNYIGNLIDFELHQTRRKYVAYHITQNLSKSNSESQQIKRDLLENLDTWIWGVDLKQLYLIFEALPGKVLRPLNRALENVNCLDSRKTNSLLSTVGKKWPWSLGQQATRFRIQLQYGRMRRWSVS